MLLFALIFRTREFLDALFNQSGKWANSEVSFVIFSTILGLHLILEESGIFGPDPVVLLILFVSISIIYWLLIKYFLPWVLWKFGQIWNGKGAIVQFRTLISLALVPNIILETISVYYQILDLKFDLVTFNTPQIFVLIISVIYFRILVIGIAKIQRFTYGLALLNLLLPFGILQLLGTVILNIIRG